MLKKVNIPQVMYLVMFIQVYDFIVINPYITVIQRHLIMQDFNHDWLFIILKTSLLMLMN